MEIKIEKGALVEGLASVQGVVDRKTTMPILSNVLLETKSGGLQFSATDLEIGVTHFISAEIKKEGKAAVPARGLYEFVKELPNQPVELKVLENGWLDIRCAKSFLKLVGMDPKEYPTLPEKKDGAEFSLPVETLLEMINKVAFAASTDESRHNLNGILVETGAKEEKNYLRFVSTDGHRLSIEQKELKKALPIKKGVLFPRKGVNELKRMLEGKEGGVFFWVGEKQAVIEKDERILTIRLIDGQFPPYEHVVPANNKKIMAAPKDALAASLKRISKVTSDRSRGVKFTFSPGNLEISAKNPDLGDAKEELSVQYKGATFSVGFNALYFLECLSVLEDEQVVLQLADEVSPCLIQSEADLGFTHVIMPMRI